MKKFNLLYLAIIPLCYALYQMNSSLGQASAFFYGFAENKETELSHDKAVSIEEILVIPGQAVTKGELLMKVKQSSIGFKIESANLDMKQLEIQTKLRKQEINDRIEQLEIKRNTKAAEIDADIKSLEAVIAYNKSLLNDLESFKNEDLDQKESPNQIKLNALEESKALVMNPVDAEIKQLKNELAYLRTPSAVQQQKIQGEIDYYKDEQNQLEILAPSDGLIGNILCKEGENFPAFKTFIRFYERNPTIVKGFVHESLILQVKVGDTLLVSSTLHPEQQIEGMVTGLGSRIVEIPERLRKMPDIKTYGREVLISIPADNSFLQKEKVMLNSLHESAENSFASFFSLLRTQTVTKDDEIKSTISSKSANK
ncbi:MAG: HlyD family secretion protein [Saprospiraceae bacterium]